MLSIKVLGPGCTNCQRVEEVARQAIASLGLEAQIEKITDRPTMMAYHLLATPGLVINEQLVSAGRIPNEREVITWVNKALAIGIAIGCDGCIAYHTHDAIQAGANRQELIETAGVTVFMAGGPGSIYATHALEAIDQFLPATEANER